MSPQQIQREVEIQTEYFNKLAKASRPDHRSRPRVAADATITPKRASGLNAANRKAAIREDLETDPDYARPSPSLAARLNVGFQMLADDYEPA